MTPAPTHTGPVRAIVLYKATKAGLQLATAAVACLLWPFGLPAKITALAVLLRRHASHGWAISLAALLERGSAHHGVALSIIALGLDGTLTAVEAWALASGRAWGPWLVVAATSSLLPFELYELARVPHLSRVLLFVLNALIAAYLGRKAWRERRRRRE